MEIILSTEQYQKLSDKALAAGFDDASAFVHALADQPPVDPRGAMSREELLASVAQLRAADAAIDAGQGISLHDAAKQISDKR